MKPPPGSVSVTAKHCNILTDVKSLYVKTQGPSIVAEGPSVLAEQQTMRQSTLCMHMSAKYCCSTALRTHMSDKASTQHL